MQAPKKSHLEAAHRVVRYVKNEPGLGILMHAEGKAILTAFCDADWASCPNSRRSITCYIVKFGHSLISESESEYRSMALTVSELIWLVGLFKCLGVEIPTPVQLYTDYKSTMQIANNPVFHERTKHMEIDCHSIREKVQQGLIHPDYVPTAEQEANLLTKGLGSYQHYHLLSKMGVLNVFSPPSLKGVLRWL